MAADSEEEMGEEEMEVEENRVVDLAEVDLEEVMAEEEKVAVDSVEDLEVEEKVGGLVVGSEVGELAVVMGVDLEEEKMVVVY